MCKCSFPLEGLTDLRSFSCLCRTRDVKCLHAHVADELIRDDNAVGQLVLADIEAAGHDPKGCSGECFVTWTNGLST